MMLVADRTSPIARAWGASLAELEDVEVFWERDKEMGGKGESGLGVLALQRPQFGSRALRTFARLLPHSTFRSGLARSWQLAQLSDRSTDVARLARKVQPDIVHGLRIPYEGMSCARALGASPIPLVVSVWGNDFTLHARESQRVEELTRETLARADGLHSDCRRDQELALELGWDARRPTLVVPGSGGVVAEWFFQSAETARDPEFVQRLGEGPWILNPRGIRAYVDTGAFLGAVPEVLARFPSAVFVLPGTAGHPLAEAFRRRSVRPDAVHLLPQLSPQGMGKLYRGSEVFVSPSTHDGTPNTLLEGMACGSYPIVGDVESVREWIRDGMNGTVLRDLRPETVAESVIRALTRREERRAAAILNSRIVEERADRRTCVRRISEFYSAVVERKRDRGRS